VDLIRAQDVPAHGLDQRPQQGGGLAHPAGQGRTRQIDPGAGVDFGLAVQRQVIRIFRDQHVRQQAGTGQSARDRPTGRRGLDDPVAAAARPFGPDVADDAKVRGNVLQPL